MSMKTNEIGRALALGVVCVLAMGPAVWAEAAVHPAMSGMALPEKIARPKLAAGKIATGKMPHIAASNPHLHGLKVEEVVHHKVVGWQLHHWEHAWNYVGWMGVHRNLGRVEGIVVDEAGRPVPHAHVWLKHPGGATFKALAMKHITNARANGVFVMNGVRAGKYRVVATYPGMKRSHVVFVVHRGMVSTPKIAM